MQKLRTLHLYLGCIFAPRLVFFAVSGLWQTFGLRGNSKLLTLLSTIHMSRGLKGGHPSSLSSLPMIIFVAAMTVGLIITTILGVIMALKYGRNRKMALACLAFGVLFPLTLVLIQLLA